ncbi:Tigger transposable element-derived protein [Operophtera brumata]|uniref:Tigger transposable element-derived protein n=1 Tax=Operophtera brumata TaxID=104452 RepID=A0A0L7L9B1_OPEBR|nr:Tigger transposable element-derived protein [Operophtera brumata]
MSSVKRKCFTIEEKSAILHRLEAGESNATLAKEFGVSHSTISTIKKNKDKIEPLFNANVLKCKRVRTSTHEQVDKALLQWFKLQRDRGIPVNGPLLQEKANFFARQLDMQNFTCSMSWINRFKVRHNIVSVRDNLTEFLKETRFGNSSAEQPQRKKKRLHVEPGKSISTLEDEETVQENDEVTDENNQNTQNTMDREDSAKIADSVDAGAGPSNPTYQNNSEHSDIDSDATRCEGPEIGMFIFVLYTGIDSLESKMSIPKQRNTMSLIEGAEENEPDREEEEE